MHDSIKIANGAIEAASELPNNKEAFAVLNGAVESVRDRFGIVDASIAECILDGAYQMLHALTLRFMEEAE